MLTNSLIMNLSRLSLQRLTSMQCARTFLHKLTQQLMNTSVYQFYTAPSIMKKPRCKYWTKYPMLTITIFHKTLSYKQFLVLKKCLHFSSNSIWLNQIIHNKIWSILEPIKRKVKIHCTPERDMTIDVSLMLCKGRLLWVHLMPLKRARLGIMLCEF